MRVEKVLRLGAAVFRAVELLEKPLPKPSYVAYAEARLALEFLERVVAEVAGAVGQSFPFL